MSGDLSQMGRDALLRLLRDSIGQHLRQHYPNTQLNAFVRELINNPEGLRSRQQVEALLARLESLPPDSLDEDDVRRMVREIIRPPQGQPSTPIQRVLNAAMQLPTDASAAERERFAQEQAAAMIAGMVPAQYAQNAQAFLTAYHQAGLSPRSSRSAHRRFFTDYVARTSPQLSPQEQRSAVNQLVTTYKPRRGPLAALPEGCALVLTFAVVISVLGVILLGLLAALLWQTGTFAETRVGQALAATLVVMSLGASALLWLRHNAANPLTYVQAAIALLCVGGVAFALIASGTLDPQTVDLDSDEGRTRLLGAGVMAVSLGAVVFLWIRRLFAGIIWLALTLCLLAIAIVAAWQSGILPDLLDSLNGTTP